MRTSLLTTLDIIARNPGDGLHHFKHSGDDLLQEFCLLADDFICDLVCKNQNALQSIQKGGGNLVVLVSFLQNLQSQASPRRLIGQQRTRTSNVTLARPKTAFVTGFNWKVSISCRFPYWRTHRGDLTSAKMAPYLITLSTTLSVWASIIGEYFSNNPSSSLSDERRDSAYANIVSWLGWGIAKRHTSAFAENCSSREQLRFPMVMVTVLLHQV